MITDVFDFVRTIIKDGIKPNYSKIFIHFNCFVHNYTILLSFNNLV